jgi:hypothetical protein
MGRQQYRFPVRQLAGPAGGVRPCPYVQRQPARSPHARASLSYSPRMSSVAGEVLLLVKWVKDERRDLVRPRCLIVKPFGEKEGRLLVQESALVF